MPFGGGIRRCIGASFATLEMKEVLHRMVRRGRFAAASRRSERPFMRAIFFSPLRGGRVVLEELAPVALAPSHGPSSQASPVSSVGGSPSGS
jgi:hypothetical protein